MKVGIITMISDNYGNRLQNYALQQSIKKLGAEIETFHNPFLYEYSEWKHILKKPIKTMLYSLSLKKRGLLKRENAFEKFNRKYITWSKFWLNNPKHTLKIDKCYDRVICGSDQIWNPESTNIDGRYFGTFVASKKRFSYAASFGLTEIPLQRRNEWTEYLNGMSQISVREEAGKQIVQELTQRICMRHLDPTLLLDEFEWRIVEHKPSNVDISRKYVLTYFLGKPNEEQQTYIQKIAESKKCTILELNNVEIPSLYSCGPAEFLYLIDHAECIFTDSFHGTVFSILFQKKFKIFERNGLINSMSSRIDNLLDILELENSGCRYEGEHDEIMLPDYEATLHILQKEKEKSMSYLSQVLR